MFFRRLQAEQYRLIGLGKRLNTIQLQAFADKTQIDPEFEQCPDVVLRFVQSVLQAIGGLPMLAEGRQR